MFIRFGVDFDFNFGSIWNSSLYLCNCGWDCDGNWCIFEFLVEGVGIGFLVVWVGCVNRYIGSL